MRRLKRYFPWLLVVIMGWYLWSHRHSISQEEDAMNQPVAHRNTVILGQIEALGKLELVKYNFQEVTEVQEMGKEYFKIFKVEPDAKAILITQGEAVGCIDLTRMKIQDVSVTEDTLYIKLPEPEICYYKLNLEKTRLYSVETGFFTDRDKFIERAYQQAEQDIKQAALNTGILEQTKDNARMILKPMLEEMTGKTVIIREEIPPVQLNRSS